MAWLLIDNSNNRTKLALGDGKRLSGWRGMVPTAELSPEVLEKLLENVQYDAVVCASVVPGKAGMLRDFFRNSFPFRLLGYDSPHGLGFDLESPEQVGNDRLANSIALLEKYGAPGIAVDFGTAVTFSVVSPDGKFSGGVIAPGMEAMTERLSARTAQLPHIDTVEPTNAIGKTTVEAMRSGAVIGHRGMVREILREIISEMGVAPKVIATGGGAAFAAPHIGEIDLVDPDLTLEGLRLFAGRIF